MECVVLIGLVLGQKWTGSYQSDCYWDSSGLCCMSRNMRRSTGTRAEVDCFISAGLVLGQLWNVGYQ